MRCERASARHIRSVTAPNTPPYTVPAARFPFLALAEQAGRAPIGGAREVALACLMAARLAAAGADAAALPAAARRERVASARAWLATIALPPALREALARLAELSARPDAAATAAALGAVLAGARRQLSAGAVAELEALVDALREGAATAGVQDAPRADGPAPRRARGAR